MSCVCLLSHAPRFATMAELDAWIESCKNPHVDHYPPSVTEDEWAWYKSQGRGSGNYRR